jgi:REP element-mobilizing transposase RayT
MATAQSVTHAPEWLQDASQATQRLTQLSLELTAQAILILRDKGLWAYAGQLSQPEVQELTKCLSNYWVVASDPSAPGVRPRGWQGDMVRRVRLETTRDEFILYATSLCEGMVLSLAFDSNTPFSTIRSQTNFLAKTLLSDCVSPPSPKQEEEVSSGLVNIPVWLEQPIDEQQSTPSTNQAKTTPPSIPHPTSENLAETKPHTLQDLGSTWELIGFVDLQPATPTLHHLSYSCMIIPRFPQHQLRDTLASHLEEWLKQLCLAFGWRLEQIKISPGYLQVIIRATPFTSPSTLMRIIRQQTSQRIYSTFPPLVHENPCSDFWAPGYLIISNNRFPSQHITQQFIAQTRQQQGTLQTVDRTIT